MVVAVGYWEKDWEGRRYSERMGMGGVLLPQPGAHELPEPVGSMYRGVLGKSATVGHRGHWYITSQMNEGRRR